MPTDVFMGPLQGIYKAERSLLGFFPQVITDGVVDILIDSCSGVMGAVFMPWRSALGCAVPRSSCHRLERRGRKRRLPGADCAAADGIGPC